MFFNNYTKPGKGINKEDLDKSGIELYLDIFFRRIWKLMTLNLLYVFVSIPAIAVSVAVSLYLFTIAASLRGIDINENAKFLLILGVLLSIAFFQITGSGPASVAKSYVLRRYVNDTHSWVFSDFFENIKKNFIQGIAVYIINTLLITGLLFAYVFYSLVLEKEIFSVVAIVLIVVFSMMQMYVHQLVASVELKVKYIYKNALALTVIKLPWNILVTAVTIALMYGMYTLALSIPIACIILIPTLYFVVVDFTQIFMTNNVIKKYVIEPGMTLEKEE